MIKIFKTRYEEIYLSDDRVNGTIIKLDKKLGIGVKVRDGILWILELQPENKKRMNFVEFLNGYRPNIGERFE